METRSEFSFGGALADKNLTVYRVVDVATWGSMGSAAKDGAVYVQDVFVRTRAGFGWLLVGATAGYEKKVDVYVVAGVTDWGDGFTPGIAVYLLSNRRLNSDGRPRDARATRGQKVPRFSVAGLKGTHSWRAEWTQIQ